MMTDWERETFTREANTLAADALARGNDLRAALVPSFYQALRAHPDEEDRLLELWDRLNSRPVL